MGLTSFSRIKWKQAFLVALIAFVLLAAAAYLGYGKFVRVINVQAEAEKNGVAANWAIQQANELKRREELWKFIDESDGPALDERFGSQLYEMPPNLSGHIQSAHKGLHVKPLADFDRSFLKYFYVGNREANLQRHPSYAEGNFVLNRTNAHRYGVVLTDGKKNYNLLVETSGPGVLVEIHFKVTDEPNPYISFNSRAGDVFGFASYTPRDEALPYQE